MKSSKVGMQEKPRIRRTLYGGKERKLYAKGKKYLIYCSTCQFGMCRKLTIVSLLSGSLWLRWRGISIWLGYSQLYRQSSSFEQNTLYTTIHYCILYSLYSTVQFPTIPNYCRMQLVCVQLNDKCIQYANRGQISFIYGGRGFGL